MLGTSLGYRGIPASDVRGRSVGLHAKPLRQGGRPSRDVVHLGQVASRFRPAKPGRPIGDNDVGCQGSLHRCVARRCGRALVMEDLRRCFLSRKRPEIILNVAPTARRGQPPFAHVVRAGFTHLHGEILPHLALWNLIGH